MRRPVGIKSILFLNCETSVFSCRVATVAMLPFALSRSDSFARYRLGVLVSAGASRPETGLFIPSDFARHEWMIMSLDSRHEIKIREWMMATFINGQVGSSAATVAIERRQTIQILNASVGSVRSCRVERR